MLALPETNFALMMVSVLEIEVIPFCSDKVSFENTELSRFNVGLK